MHLPYPFAAQIAAMMTAFGVPVTTVKTAQRDFGAEDARGHGQP